MKNVPALAWRQLRRDLRAGDVRILVAALVLAVLAVTAVGFVTDRANRALALEANRLLGGDAVVRSDSPIEGAIADAVDIHGLRNARTVGLNSMARTGEGAQARLQMADLRALGEGFPLRGTFRVVGADGIERDAEAVPAPGTAWIARAGAAALDVQVGDTIELGTSRFELAALVTAEPDAAFGWWSPANPVTSRPSSPTRAPRWRAGSGSRPSQTRGWRCVRRSTVPAGSSGWPRWCRWYSRRSRWRWPPAGTASGICPAAR